MGRDDRVQKCGHSEASFEGSVFLLLGRIRAGTHSGGVQGTLCGVRNEVGLC